MDAALPPAEPLVVEFRSARDAPEFAETYLDRILQPGIVDPIDSAGLFNTDYEFLARTSASIGIGWVGVDAASGIYITANPDAGVAWLHGVRVTKPWRSRGYASQLVRATCSFIARSFKINRTALTVRCSDDRRPCKEAYRTYERCGFVAGKTYAVIVSGEMCDRHLGPTGMKFFALEMERIIAS